MENWVCWLPFATRATRGIPNGRARARVYPRSCRTMNPSFRVDVPHLHTTTSALSFYSAKFRSQKMLSSLLVVSDSCFDVDELLAVVFRARFFLFPSFLFTLFILRGGEKDRVFQLAYFAYFRFDKILITLRNFSSSRNGPI